MKTRYPRYFVDITHMWVDSTLYLVIENEWDFGIYVYRDGSRTQSSINNLRLCKNNVKAGLFREVSEAEVVLMS